jgi:hypothetical protein
MTIHILVRDASAQERIVVPIKKVTGSQDDDFVVSRRFKKPECGGFNRPKAGALLRACAAGDNREGADENFEIEPETPVLDVGRIERDVAVEGGILACLHLP